MTHRSWKYSLCKGIRPVHMEQLSKPCKSLWLLMITCDSFTWGYLRWEPVLPKSNSLLKKEISTPKRKQLQRASFTLTLYQNAFCWILRYSPSFPFIRLDRQLQDIVYKLVINLEESKFVLLHSCESQNLCWLY